MKQQIKDVFGKVLFECEVPETHSDMAMRYALEKATFARANLSYAELSSANLRSANLRYADLSYAELSSANLSSANLSYAELSSANLSSADLSYAELSSADLRSANLRYADLSYANLSFGKTIGERPFFIIGPIGSRCAYVQMWLTDKGAFVQAGCFTGTLDNFASAVEKTHGESDHGNEYRAAVLLMESHAILWTPKESK